MTRMTYKEKVMAAIKCKVHGLKICALACMHIHQAVRKRKAIPVVNIVQDLGLGPWPLHLCRECVDVFGLKEGQVVEELPKEVEAVINPVCGDCFREIGKLR